VEPPLEYPAEEVTRLRDSLNDLRGIMALPALWTGGEPPRSVSASLDALFGIANELEERVTQRTRELAIAKEALRESERNSRLVIDSIPGLVALLTAAGDVDFVNHQILDYTGQTLEELKHWGTNDTVHPEDLPHVIQVFTQSIGSGSPYEIVQRLRRSDGAYRWFQNNGFPLRDASGHIVRWCVLLTDIDERKRAEDALRESERDSRLIVDSIPGLVATFTPAGDVEFVNRQVLEYYGKTFEELKLWETTDATHPEDLPRAVEHFTDSIASGDPFAFEVRTRRFDGVYRWFQSRGFPLRDTNGHIVRWYNLLIDIDERKRAEEALAASERRLKLIIDTIPALAWSARPDGGAEFFNQLYLHFIGLSAEQASGWGWTAAVHPEDLNGLAAAWQRIMASEAPGEAEARLRRYDGDYRWFLFRTNPLRDETGTIVNWYGVNTDIEDRKRAEEELRRSESRLRQMTETIPEMLWSATPDGAIDYCNTRFLNYTGFSEEEVMGDGWQKTIHPDDAARVAPVWMSCVASGAQYRVEVRTFHATDGTYRLCAVTALPLLDEHGHILKWHGTIVDMHDWKQAQEEIRNTQAALAHVTRAMTMSELTASIAHEVNQPLSGIITNANTCLRMLNVNPPDVEGARETARRTIRDGNRAADVITRLRALFSKKEFSLEPLDLNEATREVIALTLSDLQRDRVILQSELAQDLPRIVGDRVQLQQVILNLLRNASDAMVDVGDRPRQLLIRTEREEGDRLRVTVRDAGVGIDRQSMDKLFDTFYTTKSDGMGIGLSVSRSIIQRHHGRLWAEPNDGPGATFSFSIPRGPESVTDTGHP
jgi:PAS domain S-box-containing protein